ncbi:hypothetical protein GCM10022393_36040 [Aquimarina addita]|uniref:DUF4280 domain-containing protein n=1 Tax=Aquimarina addita TaxID=870485 RepID=A0ABP6UTL8_9FLAO
MSAKYIPNETPVVCTYQTSAAPSKLILTRSKITVVQKSKKMGLLTVADKNIQTDVVCKIPVNLVSSILAFGAGLIVGILVFSNPIGWVIGAIALVTIAVAAVTYTASKINHACTSNLSAGSWTLGHPTVKFDKEPALTQVSILTCGKSGILMPILDPALAQQAAEDIAFGNRMEIGANSVIAFFFGFGVASAGASLFGTSIVTKSAVPAVRLFLGTIIGSPLLALATTYQKEYMRGNESFEDNESYQRLNEVEGPLNYDLEDIEWVKDSSTRDLSDPENIDDIFSYKNWGDARKALIQKGVSTEHLKIYEKLSKMSRQQRRATIRGLQKTNPEIVRAIKEHGRTSLTQEQVRSEASTNRTAANNSNKLAVGKKIESFSVIALVLPFVATYFSETVRRDLAIAAETDLIKSTGAINTTTPQ